MRTRDDSYNAAGYPDPTEYAVEMADRHERNREMTHLRHTIYQVKKLLHDNGFDMVGRIVLKDQKTGRLYE